MLNTALDFALNLSTVSGRVNPEISAEWTCPVCGGTAAECLCMQSCTQSIDASGDDKSKGDGSHDDPHNDVAATHLEYLERCLKVSSTSNTLDISMSDPGPTTVPQLAIESISDWIAWSKGL